MIRYLLEINVNSMMQKKNWKIRNYKKKWNVNNIINTSFIQFVQISQFHGINASASCLQK